MELSSEISKGLTLLGDPKQIPDNAFKPLVEFSVAILYKKATEAMLQGIIYIFKKCCIVKN